MDGTLTKKTVSEGATVTFPTNPSKTGYTFKGWFTIEGDEISPPFAPSENITLYAKFEEIQAETSLPWSESTTPWSESTATWEG